MYSFKSEIRTAVYTPKLIDRPNGKKILVISPHFDDEIIGCGGTLTKHVIAGGNVSVVYLTDGTNGIPDIKNKKLVSRIRKKESIEALRVIGVKKFYFLDEVEGSVKLSKKTIKSMLKIFNNIRPDLVYLPWFLDNHYDHLKANKVLFDVCKVYGFDFNICAYEVWTPLTTNLIVDIGEVFEIKKKALLCFKSQLKYNDYIRSISGLNQYRTIQNLKSKSYAEAFLYLSAREYFNLFKLMNVDKII
ncbi:hypothetical protein COU56_00655 [Candidatus Pacearchaeota archaeon CG10_big_fil_rev_8_21_14_0_10_31_9]|nr:MAG: hypothetical protein COU56_00655 [Candidatus Pacearchaeota archaeon CG10_big_fil_rev_8_21_14_0_10_31_9]